MSNPEDAQLAAIRWNMVKNLRPDSPDILHDWIRVVLGVNIVRKAVCKGHTAPFDMVSDQFFNRPGISLVHGPRGGGKSFNSGIGSHLDSRFDPFHATKILGGSKAQSDQIYQALKQVVVNHREDVGTLKTFLKESATYNNGSVVSIIAASEKSVHGPHVPTLKLDEVDEIPTALRESAIGMCMEIRGIKPSILMTSTWHRIGGPMDGLMEKARNGEFPAYTFCVFEVLERCPESRSGRYVGGDAGFENCPTCPIKVHCHADRSEQPDDMPKAKRSSGHYTIDSLIQKARAISFRAFRSDFACQEPSSEGNFFPDFGDANISESAEYDPSLPVHLAIDVGIRTGAVWFQVAEHYGPEGWTPTIQVFADYYSDGLSAYNNAMNIMRITRERCAGRMEYCTMDPAGNQRSSFGSTMYAEYERAGLHPTEWVKRSVAEGIALVDSFIRSGSGETALKVHPRCKHLVKAFKTYHRNKVAGEWTDEPKDPQHPAEDMIDPLRCGLYNHFPEGRKPSVPTRQVSPGMFR